MSRSNRFLQDASAAEIVICDLGPFQILIPTQKQWSRQPSKNSGRWGLPNRQRIYRTRGWFFYQGQIIGALAGLRLDPLRPARSTSGRQISIGRPLSFEISSQDPIPEAIAQRASFLYQFNPSPHLHYALFQNVIPQFVRIYPFRSSASLEKLARKFLREEKIVLGT